MPCSKMVNVFSIASAYLLPRASTFNLASLAWLTAISQSTLVSLLAFTSTGVRAPLTVLPSTINPETVRPSAFNAGETVIASSVLLLITAETVTWSPTTKKRGACNRTMRGCLVLVDDSPMPNVFPAAASRGVGGDSVGVAGCLECESRCDYRLLATAQQTE